MRGWRAWYEDERVYSSNRLGWEELPAKGIVGVVVYLYPPVSPFRRIVDGGDWYWIEDGRIQTSATHERWGKFVDPPEGIPPDLLKRSGVVRDYEAWTAMQQAMMAADTWP